MKARGNTKVIIERVGKIQSLIGKAKNLHDNDVSRDAHEKAQKALEEAFEICVEVTGMYERID